MCAQDHDVEPAESECRWALRVSATNRRAARDGGVGGSEIATAGAGMGASAHGTRSPLATTLDDALLPSSTTSVAVTLRLAPHPRPSLSAKHLLSQPLKLPSSLGLPARAPFSGSPGRRNPHFSHARQPQSLVSHRTTTSHAQATVISHHSILQAGSRSNEAKLLLRLAFDRHAPSNASRSHLPRKHQGGRQTREGLRAFLSA